jgi:hypothetical protein
MLNRRFTIQYPLPVILGIEEFLDGPILSYINQRGFVAFGFEGGQHQSPEAVDNHYAFCLLSLHYAGMIPAEEFRIKDYEKYLRDLPGPPEHFYEITDRYQIQPDENFKMMPGFKNFQVVPKGTPLANSNGREIYAAKSFRIFMPLYQEQGHDGYFMIKKIPEIILGLSALVRRLRMDKFVARMPGIRWADREHTSLLVNRSVARFYAKPIFHLLGYRSREITAHHYIMKNREASARAEDYRGAPWLGN